jgi:predicted transcriptional regulator
VSQMAPNESRSLMGSGNRESLDIMNLILNVCLSGTMKTHIMYRCNLNSKQVHEYLEVLLGHGLIESNESPMRRMIYRTTERGRKFIKSYAELMEVFGLHPVVELF